MSLCKKQLTPSAYSMSLICQSTTSGRGAAPAGLANPAEEIKQDKFNNALQSNCVLIYQSQVNYIIEMGEDEVKSV